jgi:predicted kinase
MLCGLTGSGKTTAARRLVEQGCERLSVDQIIHDRFGRQDEDFPSSDYLLLHENVTLELEETLVELLEQHRDVVLDYGREFWTRAGRDRYKKLVEDHGASWTLIYLQADRELLLERLFTRNRRRDADAFHVTEDHLDRFIARFEVPRGEMEVVERQQRLCTPPFDEDAPSDSTSTAQNHGPQL